MKKLGSKKFVFISLIIFLFLLIAGFVLDRMIREETPESPQAELYCDVADFAFLDVR